MNRLADTASASSAAWRPDAGHWIGSTAAIALGLVLGIAASRGAVPAVGLVAGMIIVVALFKRPAWCLALLVASIPVAVDFGGGLTVTRVVAPLALLMIGANALLRRSPWPTLDTPMAWCGAIYVGIAALSILWALEPIGVPTEFGRVLVYAALFFATLTFVRKPSDIDTPINVLIAIGIIEAIITIAQVKFRFVLPGDWRPAAQVGIDITASGFRAEGTTAHPIFLAGFMQLVLPFIVYRLRTSGRALVSIVLWAGLLACGYAWYSAYARSSMIGMSAMLVAALAVSSRVGAIAAIGSIGGGIAILALHGFSVAEVIRSVDSIGVLGDAFRYADLFDSVASFRFRVESWAGGFFLFLANPFGGVGLGQAIWNYMPYLPAWATSMVHPTEIHNVFLEAGAELGITGMAAVTGMWVLAFRSVAMAWRDNLLGACARTLFVALVGQLVFLWFTPMVRDMWFTLPFAAALGRMSAERRQGEGTAA